MYEVTVRNHWGDKIVRRVPVDNPCTPLSEIIESGQQSEHTRFLAESFLQKHGRSSLRYFWFPDRIPEPPPPQPKPEPVSFDALVNLCSV